MFGLIKRDLLVQRKRFWLAGGYCLFGPIMHRALGQSTLVVIVVGVVYTLLLYDFQDEDRDRVDMTMVSLPIPRKSLVIARYLEVLLLAAAAMIFYLLVTKACPWLYGSFPNRWAIPAAALLMISLLCGVNFPIIYRMGYMRARVFNMMIMILGLLIPVYVLGYKVIKDPHWRTAIENAPAATSILMTASSIVILAASCLLSIRLYRKRQF